jgi:hypothetical protein
LAPTSAFAGGGGGGGWHGGGFHGGGFGFGVGTAIGLGILAGAAYDSSCMAQRVFNTPDRTGGALGQRLLLSRSLSHVRNGNPGLARGRGVFMQVRSIIPGIIRDCLHTTGSAAAYLRPLTTPPFSS